MVTKASALALLLSLGLLFATAASAKDDAEASLERLVSDLQTIDRDAPGLSQMADHDAFIAEDAPAMFRSGVLGVPPPATPPAMRELVRRGVAALPVLIAHLGDRRPTRLAVGQRFTAGGFFMWGVFGEEYDPRSRLDAKARRSAAADIERQMQRPLPDTYVVKVGDVCYALIGQIVNRRLRGVRYQPSGGIIVNSPIESPSLVDQISKDWGGLDATHHRDALLADIAAERRTWEFAPAFARLRFYYPDAYRSLSGRDLEKRNAFEIDDRTYLSTP